MLGQNLRPTFFESGNEEAMPELDGADIDDDDVATRRCRLDVVFVDVDDVADKLIVKSG